MPYNYGDPSVLALVTSTHFPVEFMVAGPPPPNPQTLSLLCAKCYNPWPCPTILDYRAYAEANNIPLTATVIQTQLPFQHNGQLIPPRLP